MAVRISIIDKAGNDLVLSVGRDGSALSLSLACADGRPVGLWALGIGAKPPSSCGSEVEDVRAVVAWLRRGKPRSVQVEG